MRLVLLLSILCFSCASPAPVVKPVEKPAPPPDESRRFPAANLTKMEFVSDHLLGKSFMPGGNVGTYRNGKVQYREFVGKMPDAQSAAFLLLDWKKALANPQYLAHMGGYFGTDAGSPVYVFTKGEWVAGVLDLPQAKADEAARELAARL
jgi:hypothetical protein